jgi:hypothetical protein
MLVKIPKAFFDDHEDRSLPTPTVIKGTKRHYIIETDHPDFAELCEDTEFYCTPKHFENQYRNPALWLRKALIKQGAWPTTTKGVN